MGAIQSSSNIPLSSELDVSPIKDKINWPRRTPGQARKFFKETIPNIPSVKVGPSDIPNLSAVNEPRVETCKNDRLLGWELFGLPSWLSHFL